MEISKELKDLVALGGHFFADDGFIYRIDIWHEDWCPYANDPKHSGNTDLCECPSVNVEIKMMREFTGKD